MTIAERIKKLADDQGYTVRSLAEEVNVTPEAVRNYFKGKRTPNIIIGSRIAKALNTTVEYLVEGEV